MKVAVVTPSIGGSYLSQCLQSVQDQTYENLEHYVFLDGEEHFHKIYPTISNNVGKRTIHTVALQDNVGKDWYGHRVYAACSFLVNADVICYLDEDNWYDPCHVEKLVKKIEEGYDWAYSLRKIYDKDGKYLCDDDCESLGKWSVYFNPDVFHIDTSSFAVKRDVAVLIGHAWYGKWGADRQFFYALRQYFPNFDCTNLNTLCYRLDGNPNSVTKEFFEKGNEINRTNFGESMPWRTPGSKKLMNIGPGISIVE